MYIDGSAQHPPSDWENCTQTHYLDCPSSQTSDMDLVYPSNLQASMTFLV